MKKLQYIFETACLLDPLSISNPEIENLDFHFYMIVSTPMIFIKDCYGIKNGIGFVLLIENDEINVEVPNSNYDSTITFSKFEYCDFGRTAVSIFYDIFHKDGSKEDGKLDISALDIYFRFVRDRKMRIEYIGQSYADDGHRTSQMRLVDHSTLQKVFATYTRGIRREVMLILLGADISTADNTSFFGHKSPIVNIDDVNETDKSKYVNLLEAFMINFFKPSFNKKFISGTVPSANHDSYKKIMSEEFDDFSINVCIQGSCNDYELYTNERTVKIKQGVLDSNQTIHVSFEDANLINPAEYSYSFDDYLNE